MTKPHQPWFVRRPLPAHVERVHLIGIAGVGMGTFAAMLAERGLEVRGSDHDVFPPMSDFLRDRGISWMEGWDAAHLDWEPDLVVVGNVCRRDNPEAVEAERRGIAVSFPQALSDLFLADKVPVVVTGTHGKTTTTNLLAWLLHDSGVETGLLAGGASRNLGTSFRLGAPGAPFVVEGDEYDTAYFDKGPKFLHYRPKVALLMNIEFDHADIYDDLDEIIENFDRLVDILPEDALLVANADDPRVLARARGSRSRVLTYGFDESAAVRAVDVELGAGASFTVVRGDTVLGRVESPMSGLHNVSNTLAAFAAGLDLGVPFEKLAAALERFEGVEGRQEERGEADGVLVVRDWAHHPTAIDVTLRGLAARYPDRRLWAVYQPKSNTARRAVHQAAYAEAFDAASEVVLARPLIKEDGLAPEQKLDVDRLVAEISARGPGARYRPSEAEVVDLLASSTGPGDVVVVMANSGFGRVADRLLERLRAR